VRKRVKESLFAALGDGLPKSAKEIVSTTGLENRKVWDGLFYWWKRGVFLRSENPIYESAEVFKGRRGMSRNTRAYYLYVMKPVGLDSVRIQGNNFVAYDEEYLDSRGARKTSKAQMVLNFLKENSDDAYFSTVIARNLADEGVVVRDVMSTVRRYERFVYVRGYRTNRRQTPFLEGYLLTWIDQEKPREQAIEEAIQRTDRVLGRRNSANPIVERIHLIRDMIIESSKLRDIVDIGYMRNELRCTQYEVDKAVTRTLQLYPDLRETKLFNVYRYYYHTSLSEHDLNAATDMKENYIRIIKGRDNRIGHNWEAVPEWFLDKFTTGARFWTQKHRTEGMDSRRITIHLIKRVGKRRYNAEVDRVWEVSPGIFANPITYILECKWGLIRKKYLDDFFEVLRWSKEFGVDTPEGRQIRQGIVGVFAGSAFNPKETVRLKNETTISLANYAARMNIQLLKASDFNEKLRERGVQKYVTVQKICRASKDESDVRNTLEKIWESPGSGREILSEVISANKEVFDFEQMLEETGK
jgi:hypothetical protein